MLVYLAEAGVKLTLLGLEKVYSGISYLYYGHQETTEEKILAKLQELEKTNQDLNQKLAQLESDIEKSD